MNASTVQKLRDIHCSAMAEELEAHFRLLIFFVPVCQRMLVLGIAHLTCHLCYAEIILNV